ncbi:MAG: hypothetical protein ACTHN0_20095 [Aquihabitans sp.]
MAKRWVAGALVATFVLAGCSGSGGSDSADETTTTKAAETTTSTTEVDLSEVGADYQDAIEEVDGAIDDEVETRDAFAAENDLDGGIDSTRDVRNDLYDFDGAVRKLDLPDDQKSAANDVLTETGRYIEVLDGYQEVTDIDGYNAQLDDEADARVAWYEAVNALADELEVDGVENDIDDSSGSDTTTTEPSDEEVQAGDTVETSTVSMEVPEGFVATASSTIEMTGDDGATVGVYSVYPDSGTTLEDVAEASADGTAEKNDYELIGGHEEMTVGDYDALGYAFDDGEGNPIVDIYFEAEDSAGGQWHLVSIEAPEGSIDQVMESVEAVLDTVVVS